MSGTAVRRRPGLVVLVVIGLGLLSVLLLPLAAYVLDRLDENLILPAHFAVMAIAGVGAWTIPGVARRGASRVSRLLVGAVVGLLTGLVGIGVFFLLLNGRTGA